MDDSLLLEKIQKHEWLVGVDEVGRGPIAGPVTLCAFGVEARYYDEVLESLSGITDSKQLSEQNRILFVKKIRALERKGKCTISLSLCSAGVIDTKGISFAIRSALARSLKKFNPQTSFIFLDGSLFAPPIFEHQKTIIKGDRQNWLIGAASVLAKVHRDSFMKRMAKKYPLYAFDEHKGYGTEKHRELIHQFGTCDLHRKTWIKNS